MRKPLLRINHHRPKKLTAAEHDDAYRKIGCTDGIKKLKDRERVTKKRRKGR